MSALTDATEVLQQTQEHISEAWLYWTKGELLVNAGRREEESRFSGAL